MASATGMLLYPCLKQHPIMMGFLCSRAYCSLTIPRYIQRCRHILRCQQSANQIPHEEEFEAQTLKAKRLADPLETM
ncbi:hypothetical protein PTKIN_Ptkin10aG0054400 [Pterospermum kingtungense]